MQHFTFLNKELISALTAEHSTPFYIYSQNTIEQQCETILSIPAPFGLTARYAIKANPNTAILKVIENTGFHFDASSEYEVIRCLKAGISADKIQLTSQEMSSEHLELIIKEGVRFNACSLEQLRRYATLAPRGSEISIRINPGLGSGSSRKTNVGGPSSSFGIWFEQVDEAKQLAADCGLRITRLHSHIGSGADPAVWERAASLTLAVARQLPEVVTLNLGGGFKVARHAGEVSTSIEAVGKVVADVLLKEAQETGREYHLELEPGTFLVANAGSLICSVDDITTTGDNGYTFLKINAGMDMLTRPALYAAHHPCIPFTDSTNEVEYVITGHCCESGDLFSVSADDTLEPRLLPEAQIGDTLIIEGAGAYCASMSLKNYNSFPQVAELILDNQDKAHTIRQRESMEQILINEVLPTYLT
ncbi:diaminopimelate decarboxylase [Lentisphaera profundi]|uniref:Diaminopimelate decarboxylase n=1 Tax=Lentisphaera profundi TaxID=1658616 RepID=A0ABY7VVJ3_9BACT|nr:diaminopimelate decarboxylase [Lentisphaera profundi]WDE97921.1 diaminopimelate decarboxylase [Lentisphaera profundi]